MIGCKKTLAKNEKPRADDSGFTTPLTRAPANILTDYAKTVALDQILANAIIFTHPATRKVAKGTTITAAPSGSGPLMKGDIWIAEQY